MDFRHSISRRRTCWAALVGMVAVLLAPVTSRCCCQSQRLDSQLLSSQLSSLQLGTTTQLDGDLCVSESSCCCCKPTTVGFAETASVCCDVDSPEAGSCQCDSDCCALVACVLSRAIEHEQSTFAAVPLAEGFRDVSFLAFANPLPVRRHLFLRAQERCALTCCWLK